MIGRLRGRVIDRTATHVVVDVHGVGYLVNVTKRAALPLDTEVDLHVHTHVREDTLQLFGFADALEREVFQLLIGVPTIGPVKAMGILETDVAELVDLVHKRDLARLGKLPGIGKRTAERLIVDLHEKLSKLAPSLTSTPSGRPTPAITRGGLLEDVVSALENLGFKPSQAEPAAQKAMERLGETAGLEALLRDALANVGRR